MNKWASGYINEYRSAITTSDKLNAVTVDDYTVEPRPIVEALVTEVAGDPVRFMERALGRSAD
jgi:hypothetical protein